MHYSYQKSTRNLKIHSGCHLKESMQNSLSDYSGLTKQHNNVEQKICGEFKLLLGIYRSEAFIFSFFSIGLLMKLFYVVLTPLQVPFPRLQKTTYVLWHWSKFYKHVGIKRGYLKIKLTNRYVYLALLILFTSSCP